MITKYIRIKEEHETFLISNYKNISQGVNACIENTINGCKDETFKYVQIYSKRELKGKFTKEELFFFIDSLNGSIVEGQFRCSSDVLAAHCEDSQKLEGTADKWGVNIDNLCQKVRSLSSGQVEALHTCVENFWNKHESKRDIEKWANELI
jgi:hypothetical protein